MCTLPKRQTQTNSLNGIDMKEYDIAIVGGGPAGIMAAIAASGKSKVILLEKNSSLGRKLLLTGGGRCNITNNKPIKKLLDSYPSKNFLKHSFFTFTNEDLFKLFTDKGLNFIEEDNNRIFPESEKSSDVLDILSGYLDNVDVCCDFEVKSITDNFIINDEIKVDKVIIATGGVTYPQTGSNIKNYSLTSQPLTDIKYGLVPLVTKKDLSGIAGITLEDVDVIYKKSKISGNVLFSHAGLTGPAIIDLSNMISQDISYNLLMAEPSVNFEIAIDLCSSHTREELTDLFSSDFQDKGKTKLKNYLKLFLVNNFIDFFLNEIDLDGEEKLSKINKKSRNRLIENLKRFTLEIVDFNGKLSKVTVGGVDLKNINPKTLESTATPNLYFAGEVLDLYGPTGGYNLKIAFSTGYLAGLSASR